MTGCFAKLKQEYPASCFRKDWVIAKDFSFPQKSPSFYKTRVFSIKCWQVISYLLSNYVHRRDLGNLTRRGGRWNKRTCFNGVHSRGNRSKSEREQKMVGFTKGDREGTEDGAFEGAREVLRWRKLCGSACLGACDGNIVKATPSENETVLKRVKLWAIAIIWGDSNCNHSVLDEQILACPPFLENSSIGHLNIHGLAGHSRLRDF